MHIVLVTQYFPPEGGAASERMRCLAEAWSRSHRVTVLTAEPSYLKSDSSYSPPSETLEIKRLGASGSQTKASFAAKLWRQLVFSFQVLFAAWKQHGDIYVYSSPPFFLCIPALMLKRISGLKYVVDIRDLYPESAIVYGKVKNPILINILRKLERAMYNHAELTVAVTQGIDDVVRDMLPQQERRYLSKNGVDLTYYQRQDENLVRERLPQSLKFPDRFVVLYLGLMGVAQGLDALLDAAKILKSDKDLIFLLVGDGPERDRLFKRCREESLDNVVFHPTIEKKSVPFLLSSVQMGVSPRKSGRVNEGALPIKVFEYFACKLPVVVSPIGECSAMVEAAKAGLGVEAESGEALANAIKELRNKPQRDLEKMGKNARQFVEEHYDRSKLAQDYLEAIEKKLSLGAD